MSKHRHSTQGAQLGTSEASRLLYDWIEGKGGTEGEPKLKGEYKRLEEQMLEALRSGYLESPELTQPLDVWWTGVAIYRDIEEWYEIDRRILPPTGVQAMWLVNTLAYRAPVLFLDNFWHQVLQILSKAAAPDLGKYGRRGTTLLIGSHRFGPEIIRQLIWIGLTLWQPGRPDSLLKAEQKWIEELPTDPWYETDPVQLIADAAPLTNSAYFLYQLAVGQFYLVSPYPQRFGPDRHAYLCMPQEVYHTKLLYDITQYWLLVDPPPE